MRYELHHGDCLDVLKTLEDCLVDAIVTDPPYGLSFMGKRWDYDVPSEAIWVECLRVLKPGGHLLAFAGTRTQHRMACRIEDAGFEIRDMIAWVYGSGFPKSMDVGKAIDKAAGAVREVVGSRKLTGKARILKSGNYNGGYEGNEQTDDYNITAPATPEAKQWDGWGTALKPALEPITMARKPLEGTVAANVLEHGTGALNVDGCRVGTEQVFTSAHKTLGDGIKYGKSKPFPASEMRTGRWPANLIHDGSDEVVGLFPNDEQGDSVSAARFFYCAKASRDDRSDGNNHPTVKPFDLMRYLCRLITPPGGIVLDPFMGSGSTGKAAMAEGFRFIGIDRESEYIEIARARIFAEAEKPRQLSLL